MGHITAGVPNIIGLLHGGRHIDQVINEETTSVLYWQNKDNIMAVTQINDVKLRAIIAGYFTAIKLFLTSFRNH